MNVRIDIDHENFAKQMATDLDEPRSVGRCRIWRDRLLQHGSQYGLQTKDVRKGFKQCRDRTRKTWKRNEVTKSDPNNADVPIADLDDESTASFTFHWKPNR